MSSRNRVKADGLQCRSRVGTKPHGRRDEYRAPSWASMLGIAFRKIFLAAFGQRIERTKRWQFAGTFAAPSPKQNGRRTRRRGGRECVSSELVDQNSAGR
jgi:hypothetical protein